MSFIVKSICDSGDTYYWNNLKAWLTGPLHATRFSTAGEAIRHLAEQKDSKGLPIDFNCEIVIERERN
jgi:hypothetical protein